MATTKRTRKKKVEAPKAVAPETPAEVAVEESDAKKEFRKIIEAYKVQSPDKYVQRAAELIRKLNTL